ncbi:DUF4221 family protein [Algoriphagus zhangzhouensis]|uniref:DUF4221 domain-containing protein n=1 Tax=Algoriphagus zhangzhouensis TaxID=1073327 RepID=A0A1M7ZB46_9BACT|nr:DUF4221 family protein [Algoriphagus zhangzhouensis]TDY46927.1 uncharacterized protein DUF4221 [Algoriphagus zhangzhouensis]SHO62114.1 protein of unknown function [Algoriphagus zhangzhouensis]
MNRTHFLLSISALAVFGCGSNDSEQKNNSSIEISYKLDTVMVDAGDEFIHVQWSLTTSDLSQDGRYFYNFKTGSQEPGLEILDLDQLKLNQTIPMTLEGPNSIRSPYISKVYTLEDGTFYISDNYVVSHFDLEGKKLSNFVYADEEFEGEKLPKDKRIMLNETLSDDSKTLIALYGGQKLDDFYEGFAKFDLEKKTVRYYPMPIFQEWEKYQTNLYFNDQPVSASFSQTNIAFQNDSLIFNIGAKNKLYFYDLETDSLSSKSYSSQFTSPEITSPFMKRVDTEEEFRKEMKEIQKKVSYGDMKFDPQNDVYWRLTKEMDHMNGDTILYKTVLTAFDRQFDQMGEALLPKDFELPYKQFVKDGMIWMFLNIDDEVAFVRLKPTISYE